MRSLPSSFLPRLISTLILWGALVVAYILRSEAAFAIMIGIPALGSLWEYFALLKSGGISHHRGMGMTAAIVLIGMTFWVLHSTNFFRQFAIFPLETLVMAFLVMALFLGNTAITIRIGRPRRRSPSPSSVLFIFHGSSSSWRRSCTSPRAHPMAT